MNQENRMVYTQIISSRVVVAGVTGNGLGILNPNLLYITYIVPDRSVSRWK